MKSILLRGVAAIGILILLIILGLPFETYGQGPDRGNSRWGGKCAVFVNCHDARDGRRDNRGPRRRLENRSYWRENWRYREYRNDRMRHNRHWER